MNLEEFAVATGDQTPYRSEDIQLGRGAGTPRHRQDRPGLGAPLGGQAHVALPVPDYKNNILKEKVELAHSPLPAKNIDLDKGECCLPSAGTGAAVPQGAPSLE